VELKVRPETLAVCRLADDTPWPPTPGDGSLFSATSAGDGTAAPSGGAERSLVCREDLAPTGIPAERGWRALTVAGPLDFTLVGVVADLTAPLARAGVSVFILSTYDTDHVLVRADDLDLAVTTLTAAGHTVAPA
jgi:hypothetical protein